MKRTKIILMILCISMILPILASCGGKKKDTGHDDFIYDYDDNSRETARDGVPEGYQLNGREVGVYYAEHVSTSVIGIDTADAYDLVYSKVFMRNKLVGARLNIVFDFISSNTTDWQDVTKDLRQKIVTGDTRVEIVMSTNNTIVQNKLFNYFYDISGSGDYAESEHIDLGQPWWYEDAIMETSVDGYSIRLLYGDINMNTYGNAGAIFYNKDMYEASLAAGKGRDYLYEVVVNGKWTFDMLYDLTKKSHIEKGDPGADGDQFGFMFARHGEALHYLPIGMGITYYTRDDHGMPIVSLTDAINGNKASKIAEKMYSFLWENPGFDSRIFKKIGAEVDFPYSFANGDYVFQLGTIGNALSDSFREMEADYGLIPFPKYEESQEEYISFMANGTVCIGIPVIIKEDDMTDPLSAVIECMCSEAYRSVSGVYFDTALKGAYSRDYQAAEMIDIIMGLHKTIPSKLTKNLVYEYNSSLAGVGAIYSTLCANSSNKNKFSSEYESKIVAENNAMRILYDKYVSGKLD